MAPRAWQAARSSDPLSHPALHRRECLVDAGRIVPTSHREIGLAAAFPADLLAETQMLQARLGYLRSQGLFVEVVR